jgi:MFS transporter, ENTS family, enterobactin (siderophore) exporter
MTMRVKLASTAFGMGIAEFGDIAYLVSLAASLYLAGSHSAVHVGLAMAAYGMGSLAGAWVGGALIDVLPARAWMLVGNMLACCIVLANTFATTLSAVVLFAGFVSLASRAMLVGQQSCLPLVAPTNLLRANSIVMVSRRVGQLAGPALAGALVAAGEMHWIYILNAATFTVAGATSFLAVPSAGRASARPATERRSSIAYMLSTPAVRSAFVVNSVTGVITGVSSISVVVYTGSVLHGGATQYGYLATCAGFGAVFGTLTAPMMGKRLHGKNAIAATVAVAGVALGALPYITWMPAAALFRVASGWAVNVLFILLMANLHEGAPEYMRGRLIASTRSGQDSLSIIITLASGVLVAQIGVRWIMVSAGALAGLCALMLAVSRQPFDWRHEPSRDFTPAATSVEPSTESAR